MCDEAEDAAIFARDSSCVHFRGKGFPANRHQQEDLRRNRHVSSDKTHAPRTRERPKEANRDHGRRTRARNISLRAAQPQEIHDAKLVDTQANHAQNARRRVSHPIPLDRHAQRERISRVRFRKSNRLLFRHHSCFINTRVYLLSSRVRAKTRQRYSPPRPLASLTVSHVFPGVLPSAKYRRGDETHSNPLLFVKIQNLSCSN